MALLQRHQLLGARWVESYAAVELSLSSTYLYYYTKALQHLAPAKA